MSKPNYIIHTLILSLGLIGLGYFVSTGLIKAKTADRYVTVKGLSEREVPADRAIWPITYTVTSNDLSELQIHLDSQGKELIDFLSNYGFDMNEVNAGVPNVVDTKAAYYGGNSYQQFRYIGKGKITIQTDKIKAINQAMSNITQLLGQGIVIEQDEYRNRIQYDFTELNQIKPEMIKEATKNARLAAQQFANDAEAILGSIRKANQGYFSISDRDLNTPYIKNVRVVTTVEYYLD